MPSTKTSRDTRYGSNPGSGSNEPKHAEKKEQRPDWIYRQGGDQTRPGGNESRPGGSEPRPGSNEARPDTKPPPEAETRAVNTKGAQQTGTMPHLEGAEQGPR